MMLPTWELDMLGQNLRLLSVKSPKGRTVLIGCFSHDSEQALQHCAEYVLGQHKAGSLIYCSGNLRKVLAEGPMKLSNVREHRHAVDGLEVCFLNFEATNDLRESGIIKLILRTEFGTYHILLVGTSSIPHLAHLPSSAAPSVPLDQLSWDALIIADSDLAEFENLEETLWRDSLKLLFSHGSQGGFVFVRSTTDKLCKQLTPLAKFLEIPPDSIKQEYPNGYVTEGRKLFINKRGLVLLDVSGPRFGMYV